MDKEAQEKILNRDILRGDITTAPCIFCGYSGARYWQRHSHFANCPWYEVGGSQDRTDIIKKLKSIEELGYRKPLDSPEWNELLEARIIYEVLAVENLAHQEALSKLRGILTGFEDHTLEDAEYEWKRDREEQDG